MPSFNIEAIREFRCTHAFQNMIEPAAPGLIDQVPGIVRMCIACQKSVIKISNRKPKKEPKVYRPKKSSYASRLRDSCECKQCGIEKSKIFNSLDKLNHPIYLDSWGQKWKNRVCPDCVTSNRLKYQPINSLVCVQCEGPFNGTINQNHCNQCRTPSDRAELRNRRKFRNIRTNAQISKSYKREIFEIYNNRGTRDVDHIVPLNHPDICGLRVPWNLEAIHPDLNNKKSNKWDGTMDNLTHRPWAKKIKA